MKKITLIIVALACVACGMKGENRENRDEEVTISAVCDITPHTRGDYATNATWIAHLEALKPTLTIQNEIDVYFKYNEPIGGYEITMLWQPFHHDAETGVVIINLRDTITGISMQLINDEKYNSYHTDIISFAEGFKGYNDGDIFILDNTTPAQPEYYEPTLNYYTSFQFVDVDFDGEDELMVADWSQAQQGNAYSAYDITAKGLKLKTEAPYDSIDNCTKFHYDTKQIDVYTHSGVFWRNNKIYSIENEMATLSAEYDATYHMEDETMTVIIKDGNGKVTYNNTMTVAEYESGKWQE